jgi:hypothetical protein
MEKYIIVWTEFDYYILLNSNNEHIDKIPVKNYYDAIQYVKTKYKAKNKQIFKR